VDIVVFWALRSVDGVVKIAVYKCMIDT